MKIAFILPAIGKKKKKKYIGTWKMEPLTIALLKALTPGYIKTCFFDDRIELIPYDTDADIIAITVETYTARRAYEIAAEFRSKGKIIIMGGYHVTALPDEAAEHADILVTGNAETVWPELIRDLRNKQHKRLYHSSSGFSAVEPDRSIYKNKKYLPLSLVETGRGCPFSCEFCSISQYYESTYHLREIDDVIRDIRASKHRYFFFVDDNIVANKEYAMKLFDAIKKEKIYWAGQGTITMAKDKELLKKMRDSGCIIMLIGFESLDSNNLNQMNKTWSLKLGDIDELIQNIHDYGISIYATFLFGFDNDNRESFSEVIEFVNRHKFFFAAFNHLLPFPGTQLYKRLEKENRLIYKKWWLEDNYYYGDISYEPQKLEAKKLSSLCRDARNEFYKLSGVFSRFWTLLKRSKNWYLIFIFLAFNIQLGSEVDQKMRIPVGRGLDELPK